MRMHERERGLYEERLIRQMPMQRLMRKGASIHISSHWLTRKSHSPCEYLPVCSPQNIQSFAGFCIVFFLTHARSCGKPRLRFLNFSCIPLMLAGNIPLGFVLFRTVASKVSLEKTKLTKIFFIFLPY